MLTLFGINVQAKQDKKEPKVVPVKTLLKDARTAIKNKAGQNDHIKKLTEATKRNNLTAAEQKDIYYTLSQLYRSLNDNENLKAYLKQSYDTAQFFNSILQSCQYALVCDSLESMPNEKGKVSYKYRTKSRDMMLKYRTNIYGGGRFYLRKNDYRSCLPYFELYHSLPEHPIFEANKELKADTLLDRVALYSVVAAYESEKPERILHYIDPAMNSVTDELRPLLFEYKVRSYECLRDTTNYLASLQEGCQRFPKHDYFFLELIELHDSLHHYDEGLALADSMIQHVEERPLYWYAKSLLNFHAGRWEACIVASDSVLRLDIDHTGALYNKGVSHFTLTSEFARTACYDYSSPQCVRDRQRIQQGYRKAKNPFEALRRLSPDDKQKWAPYLYRIYLNLNMGKEFAEIEKLLDN